MAAEEDGLDLNAERAKIKLLQSEFARKRDQIKREDEKGRALEDELRERKSELDRVKEQIELARRRAARDKESRKGRKQEAETDYMRDRVEKALQDRIAIMAPDNESSDDEGQAFADDGLEEPRKEDMHNTVLVSYVNIGQDDFHVSYRIDRGITVKQLHKDACSYWGCSQQDYVLCKISGEDAIQVFPDHGQADKDGNTLKMLFGGGELEMHETPVANNPDEGKGVMKNTEQSHMYLVQRDQFARFLRDQQEKQAKEQAKPQEEIKASPQDLKTLDLGAGAVGAAKRKEPFVEAFKDWTGLHYLLQSRRRKTEEQKWKRVGCSDLCAYGILILLTFVVMWLRNAPEVYLLRSGLTFALAAGVPGQCTQVTPLPGPNVTETTTTTTSTTLCDWADNTSNCTTTTTTLTFTSTTTTSFTTTTICNATIVNNTCTAPNATTTVAAPPATATTTTTTIVGVNVAKPCVRDFLGIRQEEDFWDWLARSFYYQVFDPGSKLRQNYVPVGHLRLRQQRAAPRKCPRKVLQKHERICHSISAAGDAQDTGVIPRELAVRDFFVNGELSWQPAKSDTAFIYGQMQHVYDGAGYMLEMPLNSGPDLHSILAEVKEHWIDEQTRFVAAELTLANYNLGGYVSAVFFVEISPSGAIWPSFVLQPFIMSGSEVADILDWLRMVIVVLYVLMLRVWKQVREVQQAGKKGLSYVFSFNGVMDMATVSAFVARFWMMQVPAKPPSPEGVAAFRSYSQYAANYESLSILEGCIVVVLMTRVSLFARMSPQVFRFYKTFARAMFMSAYALVAVVPVFMGLVFLANAIWSPYMLEFSTWTNAFMTCLISVWHSFNDPEKMQERALTGWTLPFLGMCFIAVNCFVVNIFLAIMVQAHWEVELLEGSDPELDRWSFDQWLDWMLWGPLYKRITHHEPGSSRRRGYAAEGSEGDSESSTDSDEGENKE